MNMCLTINGAPRSAYFLDGESPSLPISSFRQANEIKCVQFE